MLQSATGRHFGDIEARPVVRHLEASRSSVDAVASVEACCEAFARGFILDLRPEGATPMAQQAPRSIPSQIIPTGAEMLEGTGVRWYELEVDPGKVAARAVAFAAGGREVSRMDIDLSQPGRITGAIASDQRSMSIELESAAGDGYPLGVSGRIGEQEFTVVGRPGEPEATSPITVTLSDEARDLLQPWGGLTSALRDLTAVARDAGAFSECDGCLLLGATVVQSAEHCLGGDAGACSSLLDSWDAFQDICDPPPCH
jgi:hypothetical protein